MSLVSSSGVWIVLQSRKIVGWESLMRRTASQRRTQSSGKECRSGRYCMSDICMLGSPMLTVDNSGGMLHFFHHSAGGVLLTLSPEMHPQPPQVHS